MVNGALQPQIGKKYWTTTLNNRRRRPFPEDFLTVKASTKSFNQCRTKFGWNEIWICWKMQLLNLIVPSHVSPRNRIKYGISSLPKFSSLLYSSAIISIYRLIHEKVKHGWRTDWVFKFDIHLMWEKLLFHENARGVLGISCFQSLFFSIPFELCAASMCTEAPSKIPPNCNHRCLMDSSELQRLCCCKYFQLRGPRKLINLINSPRTYFLHISFFPIIVNLEVTSTAPMYTASNSSLFILSPFWDKYDLLGNFVQSLSSRDNH